MSGSELIYALENAVPQYFQLAPLQFAFIPASKVSIRDRRHRRLYGTNFITVNVNTSHSRRPYPYYIIIDMDGTWNNQRRIEPGNAFSLLLCAVLACLLAVMFAITVRKRRKVVK